MVEAFKPKMLRLAARYADWWNALSTRIEDYRTYVQEVERACEEARHEPRTVRPAHDR
jgi:alkanesulfonate monooxygenase SsuD/methylene tetrahydromethanopterin reductase-like flavin-dependent oxidoreductase (luciferase family)